VVQQSGKGRGSSKRGEKKERKKDSFYPCQVGSKKKSQAVQTDAKQKKSDRVLHGQVARENKEVEGHKYLGAEVGLGQKPPKSGPMGKQNTAIETGSYSADVSRCQPYKLSTCRLGGEEALSGTSEREGGRALIKSKKKANGGCVDEKKQPCFQRENSEECEYLTLLWPVLNVL